MALSKWREEILSLRPFFLFRTASPGAKTFGLTRFTVSPEDFAHSLHNRCKPVAPYPPDGACLASGASTLRHAFQGLLKRKNKLPVGGVMVMLFVPLLVVMV
jgi:hypothetical protein